MLSKEKEIKEEILGGILMLRGRKEIKESEKLNEVISLLSFFSKESEKEFTVYRGLEIEKYMNLVYPYPFSTFRFKEEVEEWIGWKDDIRKNKIILEIRVKKGEKYFEINSDEGNEIVLLSGKLEVKKKKGNNFDCEYFSSEIS